MQTRLWNIERLLRSPSIHFTIKNVTTAINICIVRYISYVLRGIMASFSVKSFKKFFTYWFLHTYAPFVVDVVSVENWKIGCWKQREIWKFYLDTWKTQASDGENSVKIIHLTSRLEKPKQMADEAIVIIQIRTCEKSMALIKSAWTLKIWPRALTNKSKF